MQVVGLLFSVTLHGALMFWAAYEFLGTSALPEPAAPTIEAEIITISEFTRLKQGDPEAKKLEAKKVEEEPPKTAKKEAPKPKPEKPKAAPTPPPAEEREVAKLETPKPPDATPEPPKPNQIAEKIDSSTPPVPSPIQDDSAARKKKAELQRKIREEQRKKEAERKKKLAEKRRKKAERKKKLAKQKKKKKKEDFTRRMAALLDKTPEERGAKRSGTSETTDYTGPTAGEREGQGDQLTAREEDLLKGRISAQLRDCWRLPGGGGGIDNAVVTVRWRLNKNGTLEGSPKLVGNSSDPLTRIAGEAAVRAVACAAPFDLPPDMYSAWQEITWEFDPRHML